MAVVALEDEKGVGYRKGPLMSALPNVAMSVLPWVVMALVLVEFILVDELPAAQVRNWVIGVGAFLLLITSLAVWRRPQLVPPTHLLIASGPVLFLLLHMILRRLVLRLKGGEPVLLFNGESHQGRTRRSFFEPDAARRVTGWDYAYSLLVGLAMLLALSPALGAVIASSSVQRSG